MSNHSDHGADDAGRRQRRGAAIPPGASNYKEIGADALRHDLDVAGREVLQVRVDLPGVAFGFHSHPGVEIAYVLEGTLEYQLEGKPPGHAYRRASPVQSVGVYMQPTSALATLRNSPPISSKRVSRSLCWIVSLC